MPINSSKILIAPSIIATDLTVIGESLKTYDPGIVDLLHLDVMDGNFVPNLTFGPGYISCLKKHSSILLDVHLMIEKPENSVDQYIKIAPWSITIHYESTRFPARTLNEIKKAGIIPGLAINPATPVEAVYDLLPYVGLMLVMSVDPGFYGQPFMEIVLPKIKRLRDFLQKNSLDKVLIEVDGGINRDNISKVADAGARIFVAGNSAYKDGDVNKNVSDLKNKLK